MESFWRGRGLLTGSEGAIEEDGGELIRCGRDLDDVVVASAGTGALECALHGAVSAQSVVAGSSLLGMRIGAG